MPYLFTFPLKAEKTVDAKVHVLINSAGVSINKYFEDLSMQQFQVGCSR